MPEGSACWAQCRFNRRHAVSTPEETAEKMREEIRKTKRLTEKPFGVNLNPTAVNDVWTGPILQVVKDEGVRVVCIRATGKAALFPPVPRVKRGGYRHYLPRHQPTPENTASQKNWGLTLSSPPVLMRVERYPQRRLAPFHRAADCRCREAHSGDGRGRHYR